MEEKKFMSQSPVISFIPAKISEGKEWYISYYVADHEGTLKRKKIKINRISSITERRKYGRKLVQEINDRLYRGWNPILEGEAPKQYHRLLDVIDTYMAAHKRTLEADSIRSYASYLNRLTRWVCDVRKDKDMYTCKFTKEVASDYMLYIRTRDISDRTYNNYLVFNRIFFNWFVEYNYIAENPFAALKKIHQKRGKTRQPISNDLQQRLHSYMMSHNRPYYAMMALCFYCLIRPKEIVNLRLKDFDFKRQTVFIAAEYAKNDNSSWRTIPDVMMPILLELSWEAPSSYYRFSGNITSLDAGKTILSRRRIAKYWAALRPKLNIPMAVKFYSLKDTGIINLLDSGINARDAQHQADHSSLEMTTIYTDYRNPTGSAAIKHKTLAFGNTEIE